MSLAQRPAGHARQMLVWSVAGRRYASPLAEITEVVRAVAIVRARANEAVLGHIDVHGATVPVVDPAQVLGPQTGQTRELKASDRFVLLDDGRRRVAVVVDHVEGLRDVVDEPPLDPPADLLLGRLVEDVAPLLTVVEVSDLPEVESEGGSGSSPRGGRQ